MADRDREADGRTSTGLTSGDVVRPLPEQAKKEGIAVAVAGNRINRAWCFIKMIPGLRYLMENVAKYDFGSRELLGPSLSLCPGSHPVLPSFVHIDLVTNLDVQKGKGTRGARQREGTRMRPACCGRRAEEAEMDLLLG